MKYTIKFKDNFGEWMTLANPFLSKEEAEAYAKSVVSEAFSPAMLTYEIIPIP